MRASAPNGFIPNVWDANNDVFDSNQLVANWDAIDNQLGQPRSANQITQVGSLPTSYNNTTDRGKIVYLTATDQGYPIGTVLRWTGSSWQDIRSVELLSALPTQNLFDGRMVLLTTAAGGFSAWSLVRYLTGSWFVVNQGIEIAATIPATNLFAGRVVILSAASGSFKAYDVIRYDGVGWSLVGPQPVAPGTELNYALINTNISTSNTVLPGDTLTTFSATTYENVKYYLQISIPYITGTVANAQVSFVLREAGGQVGSFLSVSLHPSVGGVQGITAFSPFTPSTGLHTYTVTWSVSSGTATIGGAQNFGILRIIKA
jgi:hypothetical protein